MHFVVNTQRAAWLRPLLLALLLGGLIQPLQAARESDITNTRHNLGTTTSSHTTGQVNTGAGTSEICVFCHTPHGASTAPDAGPLWNRTLSAGGYTTYAAATLDVLDGTVSAGIRTLPEPNGASKLCLSCHDGTLAIASGTTIINAPGSGSGSGISGINALDAGTNKGQRNLGTDLTNDHPISLTYDSGLGGRDGEMRVLDANQQYGTQIGRREDDKFTLPLQSSGGLSEPGQVQCTTCHDPHIAGSDVFSSGTPTNENIKFLRTNRFQTSDPRGTGAAPVADGDIICVYCHTKGATADGFASWKESAHANPAVADEQYETGPAADREFPDGIRVWEAACLNCHDTHTASGQKKLLRVNSSISNPAGQNTGSQENTCYQCHAANAGILTPNSGTVPNIESEFSKNIHMPITTGEQPASSELHVIGGDSDPDNNGDNYGDGANFLEDPENLGNNINSRHAECTDCHNPHRVIRNKRFNANADSLGDDTLRTHVTGQNATSINTSEVTGDGREGNVASGVLRGAWGVDLQSPSTFKSSLTANTWPQVMTAADFKVKSGDPGNKTLLLAETGNHLTREYQLCFKCHSSYAVAGAFPSLGGGGGTPSGTNSMTQYTNVAAEFLSVDATNPPSTGNDQGEESNSGSACGGNDCNPVGTGPQTGTNNHRSWHPVVYPTGRDRDERSMGTGSINLKAPWNDNVGTQTMQCSDCHGGENSYFAVDQNPDASINNVQGPHGSGSKFLLKSDASDLWDPGQAFRDSAGTGTNLGNGSSSQYGFCGNCHQPGVSSSGSGFQGNHEPNSNMGKEACMNCHIAVPHGWKNKQFLVNLFCLGPEAGQTTCTSNTSGNKGYGSVTIAPYYIQSRLRVGTWRQSNAWTEASCEGGSSEMQGGCPESG